MAEQSGFFDAHLVDGEYDRIYLAEHFAKYFASFIANGIFGGKSNELMVRENETPNMGIRVLSGQAWIDGYWYENDSEHSLTIDIADGVLHRIDSVVVRWNHSQRIIRLAVKKGTASTSPVAPIVQRDDDYYELKLADIYIKAGTTKIVQSNITDKRLNSSECGLVIGAVQQLESEEFGAQLNAYIQQFIEEHDAWKNATVEETNTWIKNFKSNVTSWFSNLQLDTNTYISDLKKTTGERVDNVINDAQTRFNDAIEDLEKIAEENDIASLTLGLSKAQGDIEELKVKVEEPNGMGIEDEVEVGCYYVEAADGSKEWINPPNRPGVEYRLTERFNGNPVYSKMLNVGSFSNKGLIAVTVDAKYDKIFYVAGHVFNPTNGKSYPFPVVLNGFTPIASINAIESNGSESIILINVNDDLTSFSGYISIKYTK